METSKEGIGSVIATLIILVVIILGGVYFWNERTSDVSRDDAELNQSIEEGSFATTTDTNDLEAELNSLDTNNVDSSLYTE